jgi:hypothetical protein
MGYISHDFLNTFVASHEIHILLENTGTSGLYLFRVFRRPVTGKYQTIDVGLSVIKGRAIAQTVSRWLPTAVARVQIRV